MNTTVIRVPVTKPPVKEVIISIHPVEAVEMIAELAQVSLLQRPMLGRLESQLCAIRREEGF